MLSELSRQLIVDLHVMKQIVVFGFSLTLGEGKQSIWRCQKHTSSAAIRSDFEHEPTVVWPLLIFASIYGLIQGPFTNTANRLFLDAAKKWALGCVNAVGNARHEW